MLSFVSILFFGCVHSNFLETSAIEVRTARASPPENKTKGLLDSLLRRYKPNAYYFTKTVVIDDEALPHSHPTLTLHSRYKDNEDRLLSLFLHEQIHWLEDQRKIGFRNAMAEFAQIYPNPPSGFPKAANNLESTYRHLIVNYLELQALRKLVGRTKAEAIFKDPHVYTWIYARVLSEESKIGQIVRKHGLLIESE